MLGLLILLHEVLCQLRPDLGVTGLGLGDQLVQAIMVLAQVGLEVVPAALHVSVMRVEQTPRRVTFRVGFDQLGDGGWGFLEGLGDPIRFQQHLCSGGHQRPPGLHRRQRHRTRSGTTGTQQVPGVSRWATSKRDCSTCRWSVRSKARKVSTSTSLHGIELHLCQRKSFFDLICGGDVTLPHIPAQPPHAGQSPTAFHAKCRLGHGGRCQETVARPFAKTCNQISEKHVPSETFPHVMQRN